MLSAVYILIQRPEVQTWIINKTIAQLSRKSNAKISIGKVDIVFFTNIILEDVLIANSENDTVLYSELVSAKINSLDIKKRKISIGEIDIENNKAHIIHDSLNQFNFSFIIDSLRKEKKSANTEFWKISFNQFNLKNTDVLYQDPNLKVANELFIHQLNASVSNFSNYKDSIRLNIDKIGLNVGENFRIESNASEFVATKREIAINNLNINSRKSVINQLNFKLSFAQPDSTGNAVPEFDISIEPSVIDFNEFSEFFPSLKGMNQLVECSGEIYGNINDLKGKNVFVKTGANTSIKLDFYINGLNNPETMYLFLDLKNLETTFNDIATFNFPESININKFEFPESFYNAGLLQFTGNFSGFLSDFVTFGTLKSSLGIINTDLSVAPQKDKTFHYSGKISTSEFALGDFLAMQNIGNISFNAEVNGNYAINTEMLEGLFKGDISKIDAQGYEYRNIKLDGLYTEKMFDGMISMNDSNLQFTFLGDLNLSGELPQFDFNLQMDKILPAKLNLIESFPNSELGFTMKAKFTGNRLDNLRGAILVDDGYYKNRYGDFSLKGMQLISIPGEPSSELTFNSEYFDVEIKGIYNFQDIEFAFQKNIDQFLPAFNFESQDSLAPNIFDFKINAKNLNPLAEVFLPKLKFEEPFFLYGRMDSEKADFSIEGSIPGMQYNKLWLKNIFIGNKIVGNHYASKFNLAEVDHTNGASIYDLSIDSEIADNLLKNEIVWRNEKGSTKYSLVKTQTKFTQNPNSIYPTLNIEFLPSEILLNKEAWQLETFNAIVDSSDIIVENFNLNNNDQSLIVNGKISKDSIDILKAEMRNIDIGKLLTNKNIERSFSGILNGNINISNVYNTPVIIADANIDNLEFKNQAVGSVVLSSYWNSINSSVNTFMEISNNNHKSLEANGYYIPQSGKIDYTVSADSLPVKLLETVIQSEFSDFSGTTSGTVKFGGDLSKFTMDGAMKATNGGLKVDYTQVKYFLDDSIYFKTDTILFDNITIRDEKNNIGKFNGTIVHDNFKNMKYNMTATSPGIMVLKTTYADNQIFYGDAYANCKLDIYGQGNSVSLNGYATSLPGTAVNINMEYESELEQYDFLQFINNSDEEEESFSFNNNSNSDFNMELTVEATPDANVQLIYNSQIGDIIKAEGEGILLFNLNKDGDITLSGNYTVTKGDYLFTLQNVINKRFTIAPGGTIVWAGDPYNANIDLSAIYKLKASLNDLNNYTGGDNLYTRITVDCIIHLTEELTNPVIEFNIDFPDENEGVKNEYLQFFNTDEEKNRQVLSLIVLGKFYTPEYMRGQYEAQNPNMLGTTASELVSNQLSNWLSQISNNWDVGFNYRPGNSITNDELELALSTQIFNDRVILNGNIGNNVNPESNNSSQIVGDFDIRVKLVPNGKVQFKAYNHSNNNLIYETAPYTQGVGLSFNEQYNTFGELLKKIGSLFKKKE